MKRIALILILSALAANAADSTAVGTSRDEHRARMTTAIEAHDYDAWKTERDAWGAKGQVGQKVTKENFETYVQLHEAVKAGRTDEATALRQQLGLGNRNGMGNGNGECAGKMGGKHGQGGGNGQGVGGGTGKGGKHCQKGS